MTEPRKSIRILVADDEPAVLDMYRIVLDSVEELETPFDVVCCQQAEEAVDRVAESLRADDPFSVAFLDVHMPPGNDGIWAAEQIRGLDPHMEIVIVTARSDMSPQDITRRVPPADKLLYLRKPLHPHELTQFAESLGAKWRSEQEVIASRARLATAQRIARFGHCEWDPRTGRGAWSAELARIFALPSSTLTGPMETLWERVHPEDRDAVEAAIHRALEGSASYTVGYRVHVPGGSDRHVQHEIVTMRGRCGESTQLVGAALDVTDRAESEAKIRHLAYHDQLTGLPNRGFLTKHLPYVLKQAGRHGRSVAVMYVDLDGFKRVNDTMGHSAGDELLNQVSERLRGCLRDSDCIARTGMPDDTEPGADAGDTVARFGGDEFIVLLSEVADPGDPALVARRILDALSLPFPIGEEEARISASIGIASYPRDGDDPETLLNRADAAMYHAKRSERGTSRFFTDAMNIAAVERAVREQALSEAIERDELILYYQPKIDTRHGTVVGGEALVRWQHPDLGLVPPGDFIPLAEQSGLIVPLGHWVAREACRQVKAWQMQGLRTPAISINISFAQFKDPELVPYLRKLLAETGVRPESLEVEFTETVLMDDTAASDRVVSDLKELGLRVAMDDFGTGYSSLSYLKRLPLDILKIDRSFVRELFADENDEAIVRAIIAMAHQLGLEVIAEGVETRPQLELLKRHGCDVIQGFLVGTPVPAEEFAARYLCSGVADAMGGEAESESRAS